MIPRLFRYSLIVWGGSSNSFLNTDALFRMQFRLGIEKAGKEPEDKFLNHVLIIARLFKLPYALIRCTHDELTISTLFPCLSLWLI